MNLKERLKLEEKEAKELVKAYWHFSRPKPKKTEKTNEDDEEKLGKQVGLVLNE
ncbi:hypothetical protein ABMA70_03100 [Halobacteriovorax sp. XZX-3]|uniref:hypothetical protein n=1 Tax=unclassified Halobacteriovorax TaxID=2639665 RepID=UPI001304B9F9|nr:hypothetical protein [Halobacteriovorax sp. DA5]